jgi:ParB family chromosome partitioning protein
MVEQRRGLGRGLSALLDEAGPSADGAPAGGRDVAIEQIHRNPAQPRRDFNNDELDALADSIREKGILQPILVRPYPGRLGEYQIVAGERRWRAAQLAGLRALPVVVRDVDDREVLEIAIIENVQRVDLNALEEAAGYKALIEKFGHTQEAVAQAVGKSRSHVANTLRLLGLPDRVQDLVRSGALSAGHARVMAGRPDAAALAAEIVKKGLSVRDAEALTRKKPGGAKPAERSASKDSDTRALEDDLSQALGLAVEISHRGGAGEVRIRYSDLEQLDALCRRLSGA